MNTISLAVLKGKIIYVMEKPFYIYENKVHVAVTYNWPRHMGLFYSLCNLL